MKEATRGVGDDMMQCIFKIIGKNLDFESSHLSFKTQREKLRKDFVTNW